ncbi:MAG: hypothetical protein ACI8RZ_005659 [Myxococcota bacterium]|jgi:hypothetical protein
MKTIHLLALTALLTLSACGAGDAGDECSSDDDCADGLECHFHDDHDDEEEEEEHDEEEEEHGVCEEHEDH